jgi:hypothetical protein
VSCRHRPPATSNSSLATATARGRVKRRRFCATKGSDGAEITRRQQRPQLGLRTADQRDDLNVGDNVFHLNHNIASSGR